jgi:phosphoribosylformimino-5-aminoimidazole carboxamide ribotide isomerase
MAGPSAAADQSVSSPLSSPMPVSPRLTEISRDGTLEGPDVSGLSELLTQTVIPVIASGGVGNLQHLVDLAKVEADGRCFEGAIVGKAIYEGTVDIVDAIAVLAQDPKKAEG